MENVSWKFKNLTDGNELECNDLNFLMFQLTEQKGLDVSDDIMVDLLIHGEVNGKMKKRHGGVIDFTIIEESPYMTADNVIPIAL